MQDVNAVVSLGLFTGFVGALLQKSMAQTYDKWWTTG
jgi:hypothetical protein